MPNDEPTDLEFPESWKARPLKLELSDAARERLAALPDVTGTISMGGGEPIEIKTRSTTELFQLTESATLIKGFSLPLPDFVRTALESGRAVQVQDEIVVKDITPEEVDQLISPDPTAFERLGLVDFTQTFPGSGVTKSLVVLLSGHRALAQATALEITELAAAIEDWMAYKNG